MGRSLARLVVDRLRHDAALVGDGPWRGGVLQPVHGRAYRVVRVRRAQALGQDVAHAGALQHRAHRTAGDHAGTGGGRLEQHSSGAVMADDLVRDSAAGERDLHETAPRGLDGFAHRFADLVRLAGGDPDLALALAHGDARVEAEAPAALDDLGDAVDRDDVLDDAVALALLAAAAPLTTPPPAPAAASTAPPTAA